MNSDDYKDLYREAADEEGYTSTLTLDLDIESVGFYLEKFLRPLFEDIFAQDDDGGTTKSNMVLPIYLCNPENKFKWKYIWEYLLRNLQEVKNPNLQFTIVYIGDEQCAKETFLKQGVALPPNLDILIPKSADSTFNAESYNTQISFL